MSYLSLVSRSIGPAVVMTPEDELIEKLTQKEIR